LVDAGRDGDLRFQSGEAGPRLVRVRRVRVGKEPVWRLGRTDDDPRLRAHLGGHSGKGDAVALRKIPGTVELHTGVARTVGPDLANDPHYRVLHRHALARPTAERDLDRLRYPQPRPPKGKGDRDVGGAHAGPECSHRTVAVAMRVAADDHRARLAVALLNHDLVADAFAGVIKRRDALLSYPLAQCPMRVRDDRRRRRRRMVHEDGDARGIPDALLTKQIG